MKLEFSGEIFEETQISISIKIRPPGAELFHAEAQTDIIMITVAFRNFANAPENSTNDYCAVRSSS
jgi:hypothetical protein